MYSHKVLALKIHKLVNACVHINAQIVEKGNSTCWRLKLYNTDVRYVSDIAILCEHLVVK